MLGAVQPNAFNIVGARSSLLAKLPLNGKVLNSAPFPFGSPNPVATITSCLRSNALSK